MALMQIRTGSGTGRCRWRHLTARVQNPDKGMSPGAHTFFRGRREVPDQDVAIGVPSGKLLGPGAEPAGSGGLPDVRRPGSLPLQRRVGRVAYGCQHFLSPTAHHFSCHQVKVRLGTMSGVTGQWDTDGHNNATNPPSAEAGKLTRCAPDIPDDGSRGIMQHQHQVAVLWLLAVHMHRQHHHRSVGVQLLLGHCSPAHHTSAIATCCGRLMKEPSLRPWTCSVCPCVWMDCCKWDTPADGRQEEHLRRAAGQALRRAPHRRPAPPGRPAGPPPGRYRPRSRGGRRGRLAGPPHR